MESSSTPKVSKNPIRDQEKVLHLIQLVSTYPCIWNDADRQYKNAELRHQAWEEIAATMEEDSQDVQRKWKVLRSTSARTKREIAKSQTTGSGASNILQEVWYAYDAMSFLHDTMIPRRTINSENFEATSTAAASTAHSSSGCATTSTAGVSATPESSNCMLEGRQPSRGQKRKNNFEARSQQITESLASIKALTEIGTATPPLTRSRSLGIFVEGQIAPFEQNYPDFCTRFVEAVTKTVNEDMKLFHEGLSAAQQHDHNY